MYSLSITTLLYAVVFILIIMFLTLLYRFARFKITWQQRMDELESQLQQEHQRFLELDRDYAILHTRFEEQNRFNAKSMELLDEAKSALSQQFETVAHQIFEQKNRSFEATHNKQIELLLKPFREQINNFSKQTQHHYENEAKERHLLKDEIGRLKELNLRISQDALNLTQALRGDNKMQGNWGEVVLERILEESGLREGHEYEIQTSHRDSDGKLLRPDVLVHLPQGREIIIDSKVSLVAYETFMSSDDPQMKTNALKQHIASIEAHVKGLSNKCYEALERVNTLDFVLLFMPIEGAFLLALEQDGGFFRRAYDHNIIIVSPSTLLVTLRTIEHIWRRERQEENAKEIAKKAEDLYDKFVGFVEDMNRIGEQIDKSRESYDDAMNKLVSGRGNLVRRVEMIKELGLKPKKQLRSDLLDGEDA
jgi:DNA recombination protein RmuC